MLHKLASATRYCLLVVALFFSLAAYPAERHFSCVPSKALIQAALTQGYGFLSVAAAEPGITIIMFLQRSTGKWLEVGVDNKDNACILMKGDSWAFAMEKAI